MLFDTHAHLHFKNFNKDREEVIARAKQKLDGIVEVGVNSNTNAKVLALCNQHHGFMHPAFGLHPIDAAPAELDAVKRQIAESDGLIAVGEIGLDYYHCKEPAERRLHSEVFTSLLDSARELNLPAIIHSRDAEADCLTLLKPYDSPVIMHCFSGSPAEAKEALDRGYWISIPTTVCFSPEKQALAKTIPLESILLETDCPFLSPIKHSRNEPANVELAAAAISKLLNTPPEQVSRMTTKNAKEAFRL